MGINSIIALLGGLGAFLFGMKYMGEGLELAAGPKMKELLEKLTRNRIMGFLLGALITIVIQSSSATTVMVMGFINAEIMDLAQATGVIFGANIGTTITSILIALDVSASHHSYLYLACASCMQEKSANRYIGRKSFWLWYSVSGTSYDEPGDVTAEGLTGISGIHSECEEPTAWLCSRSHPLCCDSELFGCCRCLAGSGHAGTDALYFAAFVVCGINVGSSTPPRTLRTERMNNAKRAACIYLIFNIVGAILFIPLTILFPITQMVLSGSGSGISDRGLPYHL